MSETLVTERGARRWSSTEVLEALRAFTAIHGVPPGHADLDPSRAVRNGQAWRAERYRSGEWPSLKVVRHRFGTLNAALRAAGLEPAHPTPARARRPVTDDFILDAIRRWTERFGDPPTNADWDPSRARAAGHEWRAVRYEGGDWPHLGTVRNHFGSLGRAVEFAGLGGCAVGESAAARQARRRRNSLAIAEHRPASPTLAEAVQRAVEARRVGDPEALRAGLMDVAATAIELATAVGARELRQ